MLLVSALCAPPTTCSTSCRRTVLQCLTERRTHLITSGIIKYSDPCCKVLSMYEVTVPVCFGREATGREEEEKQQNAY